MFSTEVRSVEWLDPQTTVAALGERFIGRSAHDAIGEWETTSEITGLEPERLIEWSVVGADGDVSAIWRFTLTDREADGIELEQWFQMGPGRSGLSYAIDRMPDKEDRIIERRLAEHRANMERTLAGIASLAESQEAGEGVE